MAFPEDQQTPDGLDDLFAKYATPKPTPAIAAPVSATAAPVVPAGRNNPPADDVESLVRAAATKYNVDPEHLVRMAKAESGLKASGPDSVKGAIGPMQLMPGTAKDLGVDPRDTHQNIDGGARYFRSLLDRFDGDYSKASAAYNWGPERVAQNRPMPQETQNYLKSVTAPTPDGLDDLFARFAPQAAAPAAPAANAAPAPDGLDDLFARFSPATAAAPSAPAAPVGKLYPREKLDFLGHDLNQLIDLAKKKRAELEPERQFLELRNLPQPGQNYITQQDLDAYQAKSAALEPFEAEVEKAIATHQADLDLFNEDVARQNAAGQVAGKIPVHGMEKIGGVRPGGAKPPVHPGTAPDNPDIENLDPRSKLARYEAKHGKGSGYVQNPDFPNVQMVRPDLQEGSALFGPVAEGTQTMARGLQESAGADPEDKRTPEEIRRQNSPANIYAPARPGFVRHPGMPQADLPQAAKGASKIIAGAMEATAPIMLPVGLAAAPLETLATIFAAGLGKEGTQKALQSAGIRPEYAELAGDIVGIAVAGGGIKYILGKTDAAISRHNAIADALMEGERTRGNVADRNDQIFKGESYPMQMGDGAKTNLEYLGKGNWRVVAEDGKLLHTSENPSQWLAERGAVSLGTGKPAVVPQQQNPTVAVRNWERGPEGMLKYGSKLTKPPEPALRVDLGSEGATDRFTTDMAERWRDIRSMEDVLGQDFQMGTPGSMARSTPAQRQELLRANIASHRGTYEAEWQQLAEHLGPEQAAAVRQRIESFSPSSEPGAPADVFAETGTQGKPGKPTPQGAPTRQTQGPVAGKAGKTAVSDDAGTPLTFNTAQGSYKVDGESTTSNPEKGPSAKTVYVDPKFAAEVTAFNNLEASTGKRIVIQNGKVVLVTTNAANQPGILPALNDDSFTTEPAVGLVPLELFDPAATGQYREGRPGSPITSVTAPQKATAPEANPPTSDTKGLSSAPEDDVYNEAVKLVRAEGKASTSFLQRNLRLGYGAASKVLDRMEQDGVIGPADGSKPRAVLAEKAKAPETHDNSSTQFDLDPEIADAALAYNATIPDADLHTEAGEKTGGDASDGREKQIHLTLKYGNPSADPAPIIKALAGRGPITVTFDNTITVFPGKNGEPDVLKVGVSGKELHHLNGVVGDAVDHTGNTFPDYKPHVTLAYVKAGLGQKYAGKSIKGLTGQTITLNSVTFSGKDGKLTAIPLTGKRQTMPESMQQKLVDVAHQKQQQDLANKPATKKQDLDDDEDEDADAIRALGNKRLDERLKAGEEKKAAADKVADKTGDPAFGELPKEVQRTLAETILRAAGIEGDLTPDEIKNTVAEIASQTATRPTRDVLRELGEDRAIGFYDSYIEHGQEEKKAEPGKSPVVAEKPQVASQTEPTVATFEGVDDDAIIRQMVADNQPEKPGVSGTAGPARDGAAAGETGKKKRTATDKLPGKAKAALKSSGAEEKRIAQAKAIADENEAKLRAWMAEDDKPNFSRDLPRFLKPLADKPFDSATPLAQKIREAQLLYRPERSLLGVVYGNGQALEVLHRVAKIEPNARSIADGVSLPPAAVRAARRELLKAAVSLRYGWKASKNLVALRAILASASRPGWSITIADAGSGRSLSQVRAAVRHEIHHRYETDLTLEAASEFLTDVLARKASRTLVDDREYADNPVELASEIGAHLRAGQWEDLDLTEEQGKLLWRKYRATQPIDFNTVHVHPRLREGPPNDRQSNRFPPQNDSGTTRAAAHRRRDLGEGRGGSGRADQEPDAGRAGGRTQAGDPTAEGMRGAGQETLFGAEFPAAASGVDHGNQHQPARPLEPSARGPAVRRGVPGVSEETPGTPGEGIPGVEGGTGREDSGTRPGEVDPDKPNFSRESPDRKINPKYLVALGNVGLRHIAGGTIEFDAWSAALSKDMGDVVQWVARKSGQEPEAVTRKIYQYTLAAAKVLGFETKEPESQKAGKPETAAPAAPAKKQTVPAQHPLAAPTPAGRADSTQTHSEKPAPSGPIPSGSWMNEWDIEEALDRYKNHPVLSRATKFLSDLREETNRHSDGWPYWKLPSHAAAQLQGIIQHPEYATEANFQKSLSPIRAFYTKRGNAAGMKFPEIAPAAGETKPATPETKPAAGESAEGKGGFSGELFRGTEHGTAGRELRESALGELGRGAYVTPHRWLAATYGGGPTANVKAGTREVHRIGLKRDLQPEEVGYLDGGASGETDAILRDGNGAELWRGGITGKKADKPLIDVMNETARKSGVKLIIGGPDSLALNQTVILDQSVIGKVSKLTPEEALAKAASETKPAATPAPDVKIVASLFSVITKIEGIAAKVGRKRAPVILEAAWTKAELLAREIPGLRVPTPPPHARGEAYTLIANRLRKDLYDLVEKAANQPASASDSGTRAGTTSEDVPTEKGVIPAIAFGYVQLGPHQKVPVKSADQASKIVRKYIEDNDYGSSDLPPGVGDIRDDKGTLVARVSYNGRVFDPAGELLQEAPAGRADSTPNQSEKAEHDPGAFGNYLDSFGVLKPHALTYGKFALGEKVEPTALATATAKLPGDAKTQIWALGQAQKKWLATSAASPAKPQATVEPQASPSPDKKTPAFTVGQHVFYTGLQSGTGGSPGVITELKPDINSAYVLLYGQTQPQLEGVDVLRAGTDAEFSERRQALLKSLGREIRTYEDERARLMNNGGSEREIRNTKKSLDSLRARSTTLVAIETPGAQKPAGRASSTQKPSESSVRVPKWGNLTEWEAVVLKHLDEDPKFGRPVGLGSHATVTENNKRQEAGRTLEEHGLIRKVSASGYYVRTEAGTIAIGKGPKEAYEPGKAEAPASKGSFKVVMQERGSAKWDSNAQRWATEEEANNAGLELRSRWMGMPDNWKVVPDTEPVNYRWDAEKYRGVPIEEKAAAEPTPSSKAWTDAVNGTVDRIYDARSDLETSIKNQPDSPDTHRVLIEKLREALKPALEYIEKDIAADKKAMGHLHEAVVDADDLIEGWEKAHPVKATADDPKIRDQDILTFDSPQGVQKGNVEARRASDGKFEVRIPARGDKPARTVFVELADIRSVNNVPFGAKPADEDSDEDAAEIRRQTKEKADERLAAIKAAEKPASKFPPNHPSAPKQPSSSLGLAAGTRVMINLHTGKGEGFGKILSSITIGGKPGYRIEREPGSPGVRGEIREVLAADVNKAQDQPASAPQSGTRAGVASGDASPVKTNGPSDEAKAIRDRMRARRNKPQFQREDSGDRKLGKIPNQDISDMAAMGVEFMVVNQATQYRDWSSRMTDFLGDLLPDIAQETGRTPDDILRKVHGYASEDAQARGVNVEAPPEVEKESIIDDSNALGNRKPSGSGTERGSAPDPAALAGVSPEDVRGAPEGEQTVPVGVAGGGTDGGTDPAVPAGRPGGQQTGVAGVRTPAGRKGTGRSGTRSVDTPGIGLSGDYSLTPEQADEIENAGVRTKARNNLAAIRIVKALDRESRQPTLAEQEIISKYVGWGASEMAQGVFQRKPDWAGIHDELKLLLTEDEFEAARVSTINAHYTRLDMAGAMWDTARAMGFRAGGSVAELGMGIGNFFITMPGDLLPRTSRTGVEMDLITGSMARALYPGSHILVKPLQDTNLPDGYYDLIIGNFPFGKVQVNDPVFRRFPYLTSSIHNYFFAKGIEKLRPGGVMLVLTSRGTMDAPTSSDFRKWMSERAEFLGAVRIPGGTFAKNAGTAVTTDLIALRRRIPDDPAAANNKETWVKSTPVEMKQGGMVDLNEYFQRHPEMMMGEMQPGTHYHKGYPELMGEFTLDKLKKLLATLPEDIIPSWDAQARADGDLVQNYPDAAHIKNGNYVLKDGAIVRREGAYMRPMPFKKTALARAIGLIGLRGAAREVVRTQRLQMDDRAILEARKDLNKLYDAFVTKHGPVNSFGNAAVFAEDPDWALISSLEDWNRRGLATAAKGAASRGKWSVTKLGQVVLTDKGEIYPVAKKRPIQYERTIVVPKPVEHVDGGSDALAVSLNELGRIDWDRMSRVTGRMPEELQRELAGQIYQNPTTRQWETADEYLSGNVRKKLRDAEFAAKSNPELDANVEALRGVQPRDLLPGEIDAPLGANWIPDQVYQTFLTDVFKVEPGRGDQRMVEFIPQTGAYAIRANAVFTDGGAAIEEFLTPYFTGLELTEMLFNGKAPVARDPWTDPFTGSEGTVKNKDGTVEAVEKQRAIADRFGEWLWADPKRATALALKYNEERNNLKLREYNGSHLTLPGLNRSWLHGGDLDRHQKDAVWRIIQSGNTLLAHVVGAGKTLEMIAAAMELKRLGLAHKPMVAVPNHLVEQWRDDWLRAYPGADLLVPTAKDFEKGNRQKLMARIATGNYDAVIVGHNAFGLLPVKDETYNAFIDKELAEIDAAIAASSTGKSDKEAGRDPTTKNLVRRKLALQAKLEKRAKRDKKDDGVSFEELGVDQLFVDEADLFKNLGYLSQMDRVAGLPGSDADRSVDMLLKTRYISDLHGGTRGVVFATGTPVSNSIAEIWTMMRYLMPKYLEQESMDQFDSWAKTFGRTKTSMEVAPEGGRFIQRTRFAEFNNCPELMNMFRLVADVKMRKDLNLPTPAIDTGGPQDIVAAPTKQLIAFVKNVGVRADAVRAGQVEPEEDCMLKICSDARKASLDMRLINPALKEDPGSKANLAVKNIASIYREFDHLKGTQLVFLDLSTPKAEGAKKKKKPAYSTVGVHSQDAVQVNAAGGVTDVAAPETDAVADDGEEEAAGQLYGVEEDAAEENETADEARERFTVYSQIKERLIEQGIPAEEIAFVHDANTRARKRDLFEKMNRGEVRVMIGSTEKMGAGMNVQKLLIALHHMDAPWRPRDIEQRNGRIERQGNDIWEQHKIPVRIFRYQTEGSFDAFMWETVAAKAKPIEQFMAGDPAVRRIEEMSAVVMSYEQAKAVSSGSPLIREKIILDQDVNRLEIMRGSWLTEQSTIHQQIGTLPAETAQQQDLVDRLDRDIATRDGDLTLVVDGTPYEAEHIRKTGSDALVAMLRKLGPISEPTPIKASYRGFPLTAMPHTKHYSVTRLTVKKKAAAEGAEEESGSRLFVALPQADGKAKYFEMHAEISYDARLREDLKTTEITDQQAKALNDFWEANSTFAGEKPTTARLGDLFSAILGEKVFGSNVVYHHQSTPVLSDPTARFTGDSGSYLVAVNYDASAGTIASADSKLRGFEDSRESAQAQHGRLEKRLIELESRRGRPFKDEEKLKIKLRRQQELNDELGANADDMQAVGAAEDSESDDPMRPLLADPTASLMPAWFPEKKYFTVSYGRKYTAEGNVVSKYLAVREQQSHGRRGNTNYLIDHMPTGATIGPKFDSGSDAVAFARHIAKELDWNWAVAPDGLDERVAKLRDKFEPPTESPAQSIERHRPKEIATPMAAYRPKNKALEEPDAGFFHMQVGDRPFWSDGKVILEGEAPGPKAERESSGLSRYLEPVDPIPVTAVAYHKPEGRGTKGAVWFDNKMSIESRYYDYIVSNAPSGTTFQAGKVEGVKTPLLFLYSKGKVVGAMFATVTTSVPAAVSTLISGDKPQYSRDSGNTETGPAYFTSERAPSTEGTTDIPGSRPGEGRTDTAPPSEGGGSSSTIAPGEGGVNEDKPQFQREKAQRPVFYSQLTRTIEGLKSPVFAPAQLLAMLRKPTSGVKPAELIETGLDDYLEARTGPVKKEQVIEFLKANEVRVEEVVKGGAGEGASSITLEWREELPDWAVPEDTDERVWVTDGPYGPWEIRGNDDSGYGMDDDRGHNTLEEAQRAAQVDADDALLEMEGPASTDTKFGAHVLPGGTNYRELLMTLPEKHSPQVTWTGPEKQTYNLVMNGLSANEKVQEWTASDGATIRTDPKRGFVLNSGTVQNAEQPTLDKAKDYYENARHLYESKYPSASNLGNYKSAHWDEPNVLAHIRFNDRTGPGGEKILHVEEIQSDWHQTGRDKGYAPSGAAAEKLREEIAVADAAHTRTADALSEAKQQMRGGGLTGFQRVAALEEIGDAERANTQAYARLQELRKQMNDGVPAGPFAKTWHQLAFRRALRHAAENGYSAMSWTTGAQQAARYDLSKQIEELSYLAKRDGTYDLMARTPDRQLVDVAENLTPEKLSDFVGKDMAKKIVAGEGERVDDRQGVPQPKVGWRKFTGLDLKTEAPGMKGFYDEILPAYASKYGKKWGAKVGTTEIVTNPTDHDIAIVEENGMWQVLDRADPHAQPMQELETKEEAEQWVKQLGGTRETVHSIPITDAMRESVMEGQPLFQRGAKSEPSEWGPIQVIRKGNIILANRAGGKALADVWGEKDIIRGMHMAARHVARAVEALDATAPKFAQELKAAGESSSDGRVLYVDGSQGIAAVVMTLRHERFHLTQAQLAGHLGKYEQELLDHPLAKIADRTLRANRYQSHEIAFEIGAHLASGDYRRLGLTREQAKELWVHYITLLEQQHDNSTVEQAVKNIAPMMREALRARQAGKSDPKESARGPGSSAQEPGGSPQASRRDVSPGSGRQAGDVAGRRADAGLGAQGAGREVTGGAAASRGGLPQAAGRGGKPADGPAGDAGTDVRESRLAAGGPGSHRGTPGSPAAFRPPGLAAAGGKQSDGPAGQAPGRDAGRTPGDGPQYSRISEGFDFVKGTWRGPPRHEQPGEKYFSKKGEFKDKFVRGLSQIEEANEPVHGAAVKLGTSRTQASTLLRTNTPAITKALGKNLSFKNFRRTIIQSVLDGKREMWMSFADGVREASDKALEEASGNWMVSRLSAVEGRAGMPDDLGQTAATMVLLKQFDMLREFAEQAFLDAAHRVARIMPQVEYAHNTGSSGFREALRIYKDNVETAMAASHAGNEGVFSDWLGPLDTYYPLVPLTEEEIAAHRKATVDNKRAYGKPKNTQNDFATGLSEAYNPELEALAGVLRRAFHANNKAALMQTLMDEGFGRKLARGEKIPETIDVAGRTYAAIARVMKQGLSIPGPKGMVQTGDTRILLPKWLDAELDPVLNRDHLDVYDPESLLARITQTTLIGPLDAVIHAGNIVGTLVMNTPFLGDSLAVKTVGNLPFTKRLAAILQAISIDPTTEQAARENMEMAAYGGQAERYGTMASAWFKGGRDYAKEMEGEVELKWGFGPVLYGPKGLDVRARLMMHRIAKEINPNATPQEMYLFVNQMGNYSKALAGSVERHLKNTMFSPFYTAGSTMTRNAVNGALLMQPTISGGGGDGGKRLSKWQQKWLMGLSGGIVGTVAFWIALHQAMRGELPWEDRNGKFLKIRAPEKWRRSKMGIALWGTGREEGFINLSWFSPLASRGMRALGVAGAYDTHRLGGSADQSLDAAVAGAFNAAVHPIMGPPAKMAFIGLFGNEPYLTGLRNDRGRPGPQFFGSVRAQKPGAVGFVKQHVVPPFLTLNSVFEDAVSATGATKGLMEEGHADTNSLARMVFDMGLAGLIDKPSNPEGRRRFLTKQRGFARSAARRR